MSQDHVATQAMSNFNHAFAEAMDRNRAFFMGFAGLMRDESARFVALRLDRTRQAMEQLGECKGLPGLLAVQQAWMTAMIEDLNAQGLRYSELFSEGMGKVQEEVSRQTDSVVETMEPVMEEAQEAAQQMAGQAAEAMQEAMAYQQDYDPQPQMH